MCTKCQQIKAEHDFFIRDKKTNRLHAQCKICYKAHRLSYSLEHYRKYGDQYRERAKIRRAKIKENLHLQILQYLSGKSCELCSENDIRVLDFDHLDPSTKSFTIARGITNGLNWDEILLEIKKCRILCANCHRKHTATQNGSYKLLILE